MIYKAQGDWSCYEKDNRGIGLEDGELFWCDGSLEDINGKQRLVVLTANGIKHIMWVTDPSRIGVPVVNQ